MPLVTGSSSSSSESSAQLVMGAAGAEKMACSSSACLFSGSFSFLGLGLDEGLLLRDLDSAEKTLWDTTGCDITPTSRARPRCSRRAAEFQEFGDDT